MALHGDAGAVMAALLPLVAQKQGDGAARAAAAARGGAGGIAALYAGPAG